MDRQRFATKVVGGRGAGVAGSKWLARVSSDTCILEASRFWF